ncbi:hypothetical protein BHM03_00061781 [Ensete ventricosum]|nr:hypothetical protein BHM03_00061781 [Ensete ventricosum]
MGRPSSSRPTPSEQSRRHPRWRHVRTNSTDTLVSKVEPSVWHASPTIIARTINDAWRTIPLHHASAPTDSSYEVATPGVTKVIRPSVRMTYPRRKPECLGNATGEPFQECCTCALRVGHHFLGLDRLGEGIASPSQPQAGRGSKGVRQVEGGNWREFKGGSPFVREI